jgi:hypothetical protein
MAIVEPGIPRPRVLMKPPVRLLGIVNPTVNRLLCSRLHGVMSDVLVILHFRGRLSGRVYDLPVGYASDGTCFYISTDKRWSANMRGGQRIGLTIPWPAHDRVGGCPGRA